MKANQCVMAVTNDEYELPLAIADSFYELDDILHLPQKTSYYLVQREKLRKERNITSTNMRINENLNFNIRVVDLNFVEEEVMAG